MSQRQQDTEAPRHEEDMTEARVVNGPIEGHMQFARAEATWETWRTASRTTKEQREERRQVNGQTREVVWALDLQAQKEKSHFGDLIVTMI